MVTQSIGDNIRLLKSGRAPVILQAPSLLPVGFLWQEYRHCCCQQEARKDTSWIGDETARSFEDVVCQRHTQQEY